MQELLQAAIEPVNIVYTTLLVMVLLYWISVVIGALDANSLDLDLDVDVDVDLDVDVDVDADVDIDADADTEVSNFGFAAALSFFNFGKIPFMFLFSFIAFSMWAVSILANYYMTGGGTTLFAFILIFPNLMIALITTKILSTPLLPVFKDYRNEGAAPIDYIGLTCKLKISTGNGQIGQAEVIYDGNPLLITVKANESGQSFAKGDQALIIGKTEDKKYYKIRALKENE